MNIDDFFNSTAISNIEINVITENKSNRLDNEALFQLPFISLVILLLAKDRKKFPIESFGILVGQSIESSMVAFKGSSQHLGWSANLRIRTVKSLSFLEQANLVIVHNNKGQIIATELGKKIIKSALSQNDNLAYNLAEISRAYRNIHTSKQLDMELK